VQWVLCSTQEAESFTLLFFQDQDNLSNTGCNRDELKNTEVLQKAAKYNLSKAQICTPALPLYPHAGKQY